MGLYDTGIYRLMYRTKNETSINMENVSRTTRLNADKYRQRDPEVPIAYPIENLQYYYFIFSCNMSIWW
jgi:hypothetical protein